MKRQFYKLWVLATALFVGGLPLSRAADGAGDPPHFEEVLRLLRANLAGVSEAELNLAVIRGMVQQLHPRVQLLTNSAGATPTGNPDTLAGASVVEKRFGYLRVSRIEKGLAQRLESAGHQLQATNRLQGLILDLRFARGTDYSEAATVADRFLPDEQPLLDWGTGSARSSRKTNHWDLPLAVLVNSQTAGSPEALAALLRATEVGVIIGSKTAGQVSSFQEFPLGETYRLLVASAPVRVGENQSLGQEGVEPDVTVSIRPEEERSFLADAFRPGWERGTNSALGATTNRPTRRLLNEAELVRRHREGAAPDDDFAAPTRVGPIDSTDVIRDPVLARAVDLLKGLALLRPGPRR